MRDNTIPDSPVDIEPFIAQFFPAANVPARRQAPTPPEEMSYFQRVNALAMLDFSAWVPDLFPSATPYNGGFRVSSRSLGRALEEDISIVPDGIVDFGVADQGDAHDGRRTPLALVMEHAPEMNDAVAAAAWLCRAMGVPPADLGFRGAPVAASAEDFPVLAPDVDADDDEAVYDNSQWPRFKRDPKGRIMATIENVTLAMDCAAFVGLHIGFDTFRDEVMLSDDGRQTWRSLRDADYVDLRIRCERRGFAPIGRELIRDACDYASAGYVFDSAQQWLAGLSWDGVPRIKRYMADYCHAEDTQYSEAVSRYLWTAMAGRIISPGVQADMMPVLVGAQGCRKTSSVRAMAPCSGHFFEVDFSRKEDDLSRLMRGGLVGEVGELRGLYSREIEHIKSFITRTHERWTPKFKEFAHTYPRRCVFVGTTNQHEFLADETGERRFLPTIVGLGGRQIDIDRIIHDREQLWAEAAFHFDLGGIHWQDAEAQAPAHHEAHKIHDDWGPAVLNWLDGRDDDGFDMDPDDYGAGPLRGERGATPTAILVGALGFDVRQIGPGHGRRLAGILKGAGFEKVGAREAGRSVKVWRKKKP